MATQLFVGCEHEYLYHYDVDMIWSFIKNSIIDTLILFVPRVKITQKKM